MTERSALGRFAVDAIALVVLSLVLVLGGTQSGILTASFTWVTGVVVFGGLGAGVLLWSYSADTGPGLSRPRLSGSRLVAGVLGILGAGVLWVAFVPSVYDSDLVYGVLAGCWTTYLLSVADRF